MSALYDMTIYLSVTAAAILLIKTVFKTKLTARAHFLIWLLLLVRLFSPILPESDISIYSSIEPAYERAVTVTVGENTAPKAEVAEAIPGPAPKKGVDMTTVYLLGAAALFSYFALSYFVFKKKSKESEAVTDSETLRIFDECKSSLKIKRRISLVYGEESMLSGVFSPKITLRRGLSESDLRATMIHELCHLKHNDVLLLWLASALLCLNWFNPIIWFAFFTFKNDIELYCDDRTLRVTENKKAYAELLLRSAVQKNRLVFGTTALGNGKKTIAERIKRIASYKKPAAVWIVLIAVAAVAVSALCLTNSGKDYSLSGDAYAEYISEPIGAIMAEMDYCDGEKAVFHYLKGFFVYDINTESITEAIDLSRLNAAPHQQGSSGLWVRVTSDGKTAYLSSYGPDDEIRSFSDYVIDLDTGKVKEGKEPSGADIFSSRSETYDVLSDVVPGWASDMCAESGGAVYYLVSQGQVADMELICYKDGENTSYSVFGGKAAVPSDFVSLSSATLKTGSKEYKLKQDYLSRLSEILSGAKASKGGTGCAFDAMLLIKSDSFDGSVSLATDGCGVFRTGSGYYEYADSSYELLNLFGLTVDEFYPSAKKAAAVNYLKDEFTRVYSPYYDITSLTVSDWKEDGSSAEFIYSMNYIYYNRDPDKADYIREAKESGDEKAYKTLYDDYLAPKTANYYFKIEFDENDNVKTLYYDSSPTDVEWLECSVSDFIQN
mgnify:FL=1